MLVIINIINAVCLCKWLFYLHFEVLEYLSFEMSLGLPVLTDGCQ